MAKTVSVVVNQDGDERIIQQLASTLRRNDKVSKQLRQFADTIENDPHPTGLKFKPQPGHLLVCHFGLGFQEPENVKTRPVLVISPSLRIATGLSVVVPISSKAPHKPKSYHYKLPQDIIPNNKYNEAWIKGDMIVSVGHHRLDRFKVGFREYIAPVVSTEVLREARRCVLHAAGMHELTDQW